MFLFGSLQCFSGPTSTTESERPKLKRQQDLAAAGQQQQVSAVFNSFWRYAERFQPDHVDLDAALNALVKCTRTEEIRDVFQNSVCSILVASDL